VIDFNDIITTLQVAAISSTKTVNTYHAKVSVDDTYDKLFNVNL